MDQTNLAFRTRTIGLSALTLAALLMAGCAADVPRDFNGQPWTTRLGPNAIPPAPITPEQKQQLTALNAQVLRDQESAIARDQQAQAWANAYNAYPYSSWNMYYGGWGGGRWGGGVSVGSPGYWGGGWGGYPYGWW